MPRSLLGQLGEIHCLIWITLEAESETKIHMHMVQLGLGDNDQKGDDLHREGGEGCERAGHGWGVRWSLGWKT